MTKKAILFATLLSFAAATSTNDVTQNILSLEAMEQELRLQSECVVEKERGVRLEREVEELAQTLKETEAARRNAVNQKRYKDAARYSAVQKVMRGQFRQRQEAQLVRQQDHELKQMALAKEIIRKKFKHQWDHFPKGKHLSRNYRYSTHT